MFRFSENLRSAISDYRLLLDKEYPVKATIKLVGDKYRLSKEERSILYRGVAASEAASLRKEKITDQLPEGNVFIDAYNVFFTTANYLRGRPVYISDDGILRDSGELHGRFTDKELLGKVVSLVIRYLSVYPRNYFYILLDQPVSNSGKLSEELNRELERYSISGIAETKPSPDLFIIENARDVVCTGDSVIIDKSLARVFDLSRKILERNYNAKFENTRS